MNKKRPLVSIFKGLCLFVLGFCTQQSFAQDIHFSQFYHSPLNHNPALTGVFAGDQRFIANYRNQWDNVPVAYNTFSGAYDTKLFRQGLEHSTFGLGAIFNYDQAGDGRLNLINLGLNLAYIHRLGQQHFLSGGFELGFANRAYDSSRLTTNSQFNGDQFVADLPTNEEGVFRNENVFYIDFSGGINYHYQIPKKRTRLDIGLAMHHINEPAINFYGNRTVDLSARLTGFGEITLMVAKDIDVLGRALVQFQNDYQENVFGVAGRLHLKKNKNLNDIALQMGLNWRVHSFTDAISPNFELHYNRWLFGLSYDINLSEFNDATNGFGGPEFAVIYKIFNVKTLPVFKQCPIY